MKANNKYIISAIVILWIITCFVFFQFFYKYHLAHRLDTQLFLYSQEYLCSYFNHPAWLSCLAGDFLSQFFYFNVGGPLVLALSLGALGILFYLATGKIVAAVLKPEGARINRWRWMRLVLSLCLVTWEALRNCGLDYRLASTISLLGAIALFFLYLRTSSRFRVLSGFLLLPLSYWMFGYGIWLLLFLMLVSALSVRRYLQSAFFLVVSVATPLLLQQFYLLTPTQAFEYPSVSFWDKPDFAVEKLLTMDVLSSAGQWNTVANLSEKYHLESGLGSYFYNLSHGMRGDLPDKLMNRAQAGPFGLLIPLSPRTSSLAIWSSNDAWFLLGDMTMAEHSTLLGMIFSPEHRSVRMVKRLAEINLVNGDTTATMKYLRMLQKTWLYNTWATQRIPGKESEAVKSWLQRKRALIAKTDTLRDAVNPASSLRVLLDSNQDNKLALDYLLSYDLLTKDITHFMLDYDKYKLPKHQEPERVYAEGLLIGLMQRKNSAAEMKRYLISPLMFVDFSDYTGQYEKGDIGRASLYNKFGKTYWFYFHFATFN